MSGTPAHSGFHCILTTFSALFVVKPCAIAAAASSGMPELDTSKRVMRVCMLRRRPRASPPDLPSRFQSKDSVCNDAFPAKDVRILAQDSGGKRL